MTASTSPHSREPAEVSAARSAAAGLPLPGVGDERALPLLDPAVLDELTADLGVPGISLQFARDYTALWDRRQARLRDSVEQEDLTAALDAAISLRVTSAMVGGSRLSYLAQALEATLRQGNLQDAPTLLTLIAVHGQDTMAELQRLHDLPPA